MRRHDFSRWDKLILTTRYKDLSYPPWRYYRFNRQWVFIDTADRAGSSVLEVGAGTFLACACLSLRRPRRVVGIDVNKEVCRLGKARMKRLGVSVEVLVADALSLPFRSKSCHVVLSEGLLEHYDDEDIVTMLLEMRRVSGHVVVDVPLKERFPGKPVGYGDERHLPKDHWRRLVERWGMRMVGEYDREVSPDHRVIRWCFECE